ncbi:MAG: ATP-binding protein [Verrucomicrobiota bacterium]
MNATALSGGRGAVLSHIDITHRRLAEQAAHEGRTLFSDIIEGTTDAVFLCAPDGVLLLANSALAHWLGRSAEQIVGHNASEFGSQEISRIILEHNAEIVAIKETRTFEIAVPAGKRGSRTFLVTKGLNRSRDGREAIFGIAREISALKSLEREIIDTSEKEKQRLGHDLHENLCQYLVGITLLGNVLFEDLLKLGIKQAEDARQITELVKGVVTEIRTLVKGLSPMLLDGDGFAAALEELADQARSGGMIECTVRISSAANKLERAVALPLYRIAHEAVYNALKHSGAKKLHIEFSSTRHALVLTIRDDGIGFPKSRSRTNGGIGLPIMNSGSRMIGADLEIRKLPGGGTEVVCTVPKLSPKRPRKKE